MLLKVLSVAHLLSACLGFHLNSENDSGETTIKPFVCGSLPSSRAIRIEKNSSELAMRSFLLNLSGHWPHGTVPFEVDPAFSARQVEMIMEQVQEISRVSCVRWVRRNGQRNFVIFRRIEESGKCSSNVGRVGGPQTIRLDDDCFKVHDGYQGAILHEMMHALGFIHEHQRLDRDCYVRVVDSAIEMRPNDFAIRRNTSTDFPYDFVSIMQYGASNDTMASYRGENLGNLAGELTELDIMKLNFMYCKGKSFCQLHPDECKRFREAEQMCTRN